MIEPTVNICSIRGCELEVTARGLCRKHYLQAWRAGTVERLPLASRPMIVCPPQHPHDVETCWQKHDCRCELCRHQRKMERQRRRNRLNAYNRPVKAPRVPANNVRQHLIALRSQGLGLDRIAAAAEISRSLVAYIVYGPRGSRRAGNPARYIKHRTVRADHAARLMAITVDQVQAAQISPIGAQRRLQALVAIGYTQTQLAEQLGMHVGNLSQIILGKRPRLTIETHTAVCQMFTRLWSTPPTGARADRARRLATSRNWVGPLHWDDIDNDPTPAAVDQDEELTIDHTAIELACAGEKVKLEIRERREAVRRLHDAKLTGRQIAQRLHITDRTVTRILQLMEQPLVSDVDDANCRHVA